MDAEGGPAARAGAQGHAVKHRTWHPAPGTQHKHSAPARSPLAATPAPAYIHQHYGRIPRDDFEQAEARGITNVAPWPSYSFLYPFRPDCVANLAHFFCFSYADGRRVNEYAAPLAAAIQRWRRAHARSELVYIENGKRLLIVDLRAGAAGRVTILDGRVKALYLACDAVRTLASLAREATAREGIDCRAGEIAQVLAPLIDRGLMLRDGDRVLSLAVRRRAG